MRVKRPHELEEQIAARNSRLCTRLAPSKGGRPVKIFTDNSVETIVFGSLRRIMTPSMSFKSKSIPHCHGGGKGYVYARPLTLGMENCQLMRHQEKIFVI